MFKKDNKGFTIIEVLIVLAIAGLILLVVFLAVPALQRNSRNSARNNEAARTSALVTECLANRNGQTGSCGSATAIGWDADDFSQFTSANPGTTGTTTEVQWQYGQSCSTDGSTVQGGTQREFAVTYELEGANNPIFRCIGSE